MSMQKIVTNLHNSLATAMQPFQGQTLKTEEIKERFVKAHPSLEEQQKWVQPSDHCSNHTCEQDCDCAGTKDAIFEQVKHGYYRIR